MASFRFIHCADLHIDSPLRGLEADPDAPADRIRAATRDAFQALVDYALDQRVDFVIAAGDLYDGEWPDWRTGQFLIRQVARLSEAGIPFIAISGNHDAQSVLSRDLRLPEPAVKLDHRRPQTLRLDRLGVAIHGQGFANAAVRDDLRRNYPTPEPGLFNIGVLHTNVDGRQGHENYAPCALADLRAHGYHYWALGHVHTRAELSVNPWIIYPGNLQGRSVRETGPRGAYVVSVADDRTVSPPAFVAFDTVRWASLAVDVSGAADADAALALARASLAAAAAEAEDRLLAARIRLTGTSDAAAALGRAPADLRERLRGEIAGLDRVWIESLSVEVSPPGRDDAAAGPLLSAIGQVGAADLEEGAAAYCQAMLDRLPGLRDELKTLEGAENLLALDRTRTLPPPLLAKAKALLLAHLGDG
ncbi:metallophosphoesterase family protein [Rhodopila sp.]|uniref:metallophosphoesterase family protein n=1 Tax=Rhodopila sp. TaxID=2480087 RepID=UPI002B7DD4EF|nr:DNA repair exonuclease [Rhodopila sp.]HVZ10753.1 DNA repair exonuclease [Rhodopila sp.]